MQIGVSTRSELVSSSAWSGLELVCGSELVSSSAWSGSELVSSSAWSGSELVSSTAWSGSELGSFKCLAASTASSLDHGASVWIVSFGSEQSSFERGSACLREECV